MQSYILSVFSSRFLTRMNAFCPFVLLFAFAIGSAVPLRNDCEGDSQCLPGWYCFMTTKYCAPCTDCAVYKRINVSWRSCAKGPSECGTCLSGFEEDILAGGQTRDWCIESSRFSAAHMYASGNNKVHVGWPVAIVLVMLAVFCAVFWQTRRAAGNVMPEPPPVYTASCNPMLQAESIDTSLTSSEDVGNCSSAPVRVAEQSCVREHSQSWQQCKEPLQQAVPFRFPIESQASSSALLLNDSDEDSGSSDAESVVLNTPESNLDLEDETTMPSDWTPYPFTEEYAPIEEEQNNCVSSDANDSSDVVDRNIDVTEPPTKKRKDDTDEQSTTTTDKLEESHQ